MTQTRIPKRYKLLVTVPFSGQGWYMRHQMWAGNQEVTSSITWVPSVLPCLRYVIAALTSADRGATRSRLEVTLPVCRHLGAGPWKDRAAATAWRPVVLPGPGWVSVWRQVTRTTEVWGETDLLSWGARGGEDRGHRR